MASATPFKLAVNGWRVMVIGVVWGEEIWWRSGGIAPAVSQAGSQQMAGRLHRFNKYSCLTFHANMNT